MYTHELRLGLSSVISELTKRGLPESQIQPYRDALNASSNLDLYLAKPLVNRDINKGVDHA